jgi:sulfite reductase alpha subunit-like flavoprotein
MGELVENYLDINSIPRMSFFELFAQLADDELEKEKLTEFIATSDGLEDLLTYCYRPRRTILEVFADFPKTTRRIERLEQLLDLVPSIKPRAFSIASSPSLHKSRIQLLVAVVEYKTRLYETRKGTCSYWLSTLKPGCKIPIWIKKVAYHYFLLLCSNFEIKISLSRAHFN